MQSHGVEIDSVKVGIDGAQLVPQGEPFDPKARSSEEAGVNQRVLPENIYAAVILMWLTAPTSREAITNSLLITLLPLVVTVGAQTIL